MKKEAIRALVEVTAEVTRNNQHHANLIAHALIEADKIARQLRTRYTNACNHAWALTEVYEKRTDKLEEKLMAVLWNVKIRATIQRDPRGWPLTVHVLHNDYQIGG